MLTGKELKLKRIEKDIKAVEVAEYLGVHKSYVSLMEKGQRRIPEHVYEQWIQFINTK